MPRKKQLTLDNVTGKLSRLNSENLPLISISGLDVGDEPIPFGESPTDVIEFHLYDTSDNYIASGKLPHPLPPKLDVGSHVRSLGYERGTYKIVYNFLRELGGSDKFILVYKNDRSIYQSDDPHWVDTNGKIYAGTVEEPLKDENNNFIELLIQEDKFWLQEISPSRTEIRLRPNPGINDPDFHEQFRLICYTCLAYSIVNGTSYLTFDDTGKVVTLHSPGDIQLNNSMVGGTLKIRNAFVIDKDESAEVISKYTPVIENETLPISENLVSNGNFFDGNDITEKSLISNNHTIEKFSNPGNSAWTLKTTSNGSDNKYEVIVKGISNETYILSCWVYWSDDWTSNRELFSGKINKGDSEVNISSIENAGGTFETKIISGNEWKREYKTITIPENSDGTIKWLLGKTTVTETGIRYITNVQVEPGSVSGTPSPYMVSSRQEEMDSQTTGTISFIDDNKLYAEISNEDAGFISLMGEGGSRGSGKIIIKDAFVVDENFSEVTEIKVVDDISIKNSNATQITNYEGEFRKSKYHGDFSDIGNSTIKVWIQADDEFILYKVDSNGNESQLGSHNNWRQSKDFSTADFSLSDKLRLVTKNISGVAAFLAKITYKGTEYKTGDVDGDYVIDTESESNLSTTSPGVWKIIEADGSTSNLPGWKSLGLANSSDHWGSNNDPELEECEWIWNTGNRKNNLVWEWTPTFNITDEIWKAWDPALHKDAVQVENWSYGFNWFDWGGSVDIQNSRSRWHSGWLGYHAKWVQGEGQYGDTVMKFIDKNSQFDAPNHTSYDGPFKTGFNTVESQPMGLAHRWLGIAQTLPYEMASQGISVGDNITITWWQKSDTIKKGAMVGLLHHRKSEVGQYWGSNIGNHPSTLEEGSHHAWQREFQRYIPVSNTDEWEQVSYTAEVEEDWDLTKPTSLYVYGHYGPEGILWVENVQIQRTVISTTIDKIPVTEDLVAEIETIIDKNTIILKDTYENLAPNGSVFDNSTNIRPWNEFTEFSVDYTSSLYSVEPTFGTLRGDIAGISGNTITLLNSYEELGNEAGHDFDSYSLYDMQSINDENSNGFEKWFINSPRDTEEDLSKLIKFGPNNFSLITNFKLDTITYPEYPHSAVYKLYEPLQGDIKDQDFCSVVKEMIPPIEETCTLIPFIEEEISDIVLRTPEPGNVNSPIGTGKTEYKGYDSLTTTDSSIKESLENELLSGSLSIDINIDHFLFDNFIHFGSAEKRVRNFKYKLDLIEMYSDRSASLSGTLSGTGYLPLSGSSSYNPGLSPISGSTTQIAWWERKRRETINTFDKFENYMYNKSSSYSSSSIGIQHDNAWPKLSGTGTYSDPYINYRVTQSVAVDWYNNQIISSSVYDKQNMNRLRVNLPTFVQDDSENDLFLNFIDMIGHYFDDIWAFVKSMTDVHDRRDGVDSGLARDLLKPVAQSLGWEVYDGKDLVSIPRYILGMEQTGSETPWQFSGTSDRDISREIWSRIINNMPYFLKTKGTSRAINGLISCYGIPSSILRVVEYGGPKLPGQSAESFLTRKFTKALNFFGATNNTYVQNDTWQAVTQGDGATSRRPDTIEFRFKAVTGSNQVLVRRGTDWSIGLKDNGSSDQYGYVNFKLSGSRGYNEITSSALPVYDGEFYSVMLTRTSASGTHLSDDDTSQDVVYTLYTKKYDVGRSKIYLESTSEMTVSGSLGAVSQSYNTSYNGGGNTITIGGPESVDFGESFSGSMMEYRNWTTPLLESSFDNHVTAPISFDGNHPSASYTDLVTRYSFDDDKDLSVGVNQWFQDASADQSFTSSAVPYNFTSGLKDHFSSVVDETKMKVPNLGPSRRSSTKIRIEDDVRNDKIGNPILKFGESITTPAYDNAPIDSNKLGIYFSPSAPIDEDIILSMPDLDFDQYIGDPRDQYKEQYTGLVEARNLYWQKYSGPNNFWDYLRLLKYYDSSLYKQVKSLIPARANANVGIMIEPTVLERDKIIIGKKPILETAHHTTFIDTMAYISESSEYPNYDANINYSNPFKVSSKTNKTGSYISASSEYVPLETNMNYSNPFNVNFHTNETGSYISASAIHEDFTSNVNLYDPFKLNYKTQETGSSVVFSADLVSYNAPSHTFSEVASGTGSYVGKDILEMPALYGIGDRDESGWYGSDYYNATIQLGSQKSIFEEVVMPRIETNVTSYFNSEVEYHYSSSLSASLHNPYSSSFVLSDLDNKWDESLGTDRLFYLGCVQTNDTTVSDNGSRYEDKSAAVEITITSPTKLVTTDSPSTPLNVK